GDPLDPVRRAVAGLVLPRLLPRAPAGGPHARRRPAAALRRRRGPRPDEVAGGARGLRPRGGAGGTGGEPRPAPTPRAARRAGRDPPQPEGQPGGPPRAAGRPGAVPRRPAPATADGAVLEPARGAGTGPRMARPAVRAP